MNNFKIALDSSSEDRKVDETPRLREKEVEIIKIVEALATVSGSDEWQKLKNLVFDGVVETLERKIAQEASKKPLNESEIYSLNGQLVWAKKFSNLESLMEVYRTELTNIRNKIHG